MIFYRDVRTEDRIIQFGAALWNDTVITVSFPTRFELWTYVTRVGNQRYSLFGLDFVKLQHSNALELTLLFVLFSVAWDR